MTRLVSVDGDVLIYRVGFAAQEDRYVAKHADGTELICNNESDARRQMNALGWTDDDSKLKREVRAEPIENALHSCKLQLESIRDKSEADEMVVYISGESNFRKDKVAKLLPYKGNRLTPKKRRELAETGAYPYFFEQYAARGRGRPKLFYDIREYMIKHWDAIVVEGIEADDRLTIEQTKYLNDSSVEHVVASVDKDLKQVPGIFFDFRPEEQRAKGRPDWDEVTEDVAEFNLWSQVLTGDMTDCIYGIDGIGPGKAAKILQNAVTSLEETVINEYGKWFDMLAISDSLSPINEELVNTYDAMSYCQEVYNLVYLLRTEDEIQKWI